jgi:diguanylate cyclase (GGDEF)-like protein
MGSAADHAGRRLRNSRGADIERRLRPRRRAVFGVLALAGVTSGPWLGWWPLVPLLVAIVAPALLQGHVIRSRRPDRWEAATWLVGPTMVALTVALTGGPRSPALAWFVIPAVTLRIRFGGHRLELGVACLLLLVLGSTLGVDPAGFAANPSSAAFTAALLVATTLLTGAVTEAERDFRRAAGVDQLTGLPNRLALASDFELVADALRAVGGSMAMLAGDLDGFKQVNDSLGHTAGDDTLRAVAGALQRSLRPQDRVYRVGGDEFLVLLPGATSAEAQAIGERLESAVVTATQISIGFGIATAAAEAIAFDELYAAADRQLIEAKRRSPRRLPALASA